MDEQISMDKKYFKTLLSILDKLCDEKCSTNCPNYSEICSKNFWSDLTRDVLIPNNLTNKGENLFDSIPKYHEFIKNLK